MGLETESALIRETRKARLAAALRRSRMGAAKSELPMAATTLNIVQRLGGPTMTTLLVTFLDWRMGLGRSTDALSSAFVLAFVVLSVLHGLLLLATLFLPKVLPVAEEESAPAR